MTAKQKALLAEIIERCPPGKHERLAMDLLDATIDLVLDADDEHEWRKFLRSALEHLAEADRLWLS